MMGAMDARNMYSKLTVNKYLHTVAYCWILLIQSHDARNHEYKSQKYGLFRLHLFYRLVDRGIGALFPAKERIFSA